MLYVYLVSVAVVAVCGIALAAFCIAAGFRSEISERKKLAREALRMELLARWKPDEHALNVSPLGVKAAPAREYDFAMHAGLKEFWEGVPVLEADDHLPPPFDVEADVADGERRFARIDDGRSNTYVPLKLAYVVPNGYDCAVATPEEIRDVVHYAKRKARHRDDKRDQVE